MKHLSVLLLVVLFNSQLVWRGSGHLLQDVALAVEAVSAPETAASNPATGEQRQLVMLFNFQDQPSNQPWSRSYVSDLLFNQVNQYYTQASYGLTWITGDMAGWYTLPVNSTDCSANITQAAEDGARALGFNPDNYLHKIYIYPAKGCEGLGGRTYFSTDSSGNHRSWLYINGLLNFRTLTHEFGHTLQFRHSNSLNCNGVTFGSNCTHVEYGDNYDVMGNNSTGEINSYHRDLGGWLGSLIQTVTSDGTYTLTPTGLADYNLKAIRIPQSYDPTTNSTTYYYIEYRQPVGYDAFLSSYPSVTNGVLFHLGAISNDANTLNRGSELLDMTPSTPNMRDEALAVGSSYTDPAIPVTVTVLSASPAGATISVQFGAQPTPTPTPTPTPIPTCTMSNPTVTMAASSSQPVAPGFSATYTITVTDNDSSTCTASSFNLQVAAPAGWTAAFADAAPTINAGSSASTTLTLTSPSSASAGSYLIGVSATNSSSPAYNGSASNTVSVTTGIGVAMSTDKQSYTRGQTVSMNAIVKAATTPVAGASVSFTMTKSNGSVMTQTAITRTDGSASVQFKTSKKDPAGTYQGRAVGYLDSLSGSATSSFTVR